MKIISKIVFTDEEKKAIATISSISCKGIICNDCPLNFGTEVECIKSKLREVANNEGIPWHL